MQLTQEQHDDGFCLQGTNRLSIYVRVVGNKFVLAFVLFLVILNSIGKLLLQKSQSGIAFPPLDLYGDGAQYTTSFRLGFKG